MFFSKFLSFIFFWQIWSQNLKFFKLTEFGKATYCFLLLLATIFFSIRRLHAKLLCLHNRSSQAKLLKTDKADEVFNVTKNKTNSITDIFFLKFT